jgi:hypothetical protein
VYKNGTAVIRGKLDKHDNLMNKNLSVKCIRPQEEVEKIR